MPLKARKDAVVAGFLIGGEAAVPGRIYYYLPAGSEGAWPPAAARDTTARAAGAVDAGRATPWLWGAFRAGMVARPERHCGAAAGEPAASPLIQIGSTAMGMRERRTI